MQFDFCIWVLNDKLSCKMCCMILASGLYVQTMVHSVINADSRDALLQYEHCIA